jgi:hypothetical protein
MKIKPTTSATTYGTIRRMLPPSARNTTFMSNPRR